MEDFSPKTLKPRHAILSGVMDKVSIEILMRPFLRNGEIVDTSIRMDFVNLPSSKLSDLVGRSFDFPENPSSGYIDASIYLDDAHHPVSVSSLSFAKSRDDELMLIVKGSYMFDVEGADELCNAPFTLSARVSSCAV
jgi:hypothetical protein